MIVRPWGATDAAWSADLVGLASVAPDVQPPSCVDSLVVCDEGGGIALAWLQPAVEIQAVIDPKRSVRVRRAAWLALQAELGRRARERGLSHLTVATADAQWAAQLCRYGFDDRGRALAFDVGR